MTNEEKANKIFLKSLALGFPLDNPTWEEGPVITTFYFEQASKSNALLSKILNKSEDIAFACKADNCIIKRERGRIAIQMPNEQREMIKFDQAMYWLGTAPQTKNMQLPLLMGKDPIGNHFALDLVEERHVLIGGTTGGGKSVFQTMLISSLALSKSPKELELFLVDTKQIDLTLLRGLDHVHEIATDGKDALDMLTMMLDIVRARNTMMSGLVRNIGEWNLMNKDNPLDYKVIVIDELADLIEATEEGKDIKDKIGELIRISRAAGIFLIGATQRPSAKLLSNDTRVNFPLRICFKVTSALDSEIIIGEDGAEKLLGMGDYLYTSNAQLKRGHGVFVDLDNIGRLISDHESMRNQFASLRRMREEQAEVS